MKIIIVTSEKDAAIDKLQKDYEILVSKIQEINLKTEKSKAKPSQPLQFSREESHELQLKRKSIKLSLHTQDDLQLNLIGNNRSINLKDNNNEIEDFVNTNNNNNNVPEVFYVVDKSRVVEDYDSSKIDEIGFLLQKMFEAIDYNKHDLEEYLFSELDFSEENFGEELARRIISALKM